MPRMEPIEERENGWSDWLSPKMSGYRMACCDCGLVHELDFSVARVVKTGDDGNDLVRPLDSKKNIVIFRARRHNRSTGQVRRKMKRKKR